MKGGIESASADSYCPSFLLASIPGSFNQKWIYREIVARHNSVAYILYNVIINNCLRR